MARPLLLSCEAVSMAYGSRSLFDDLSFGLFEGDQAGLVGPNGSGKSTLLKILTGVTTPDRGARSLRGGVRVGYVPQDPVFSAGGTVGGVVMAALAGVDEEDRPGRIAHALGRAGFTDGRAAVDMLSGGWRKRLAIARELAAAPDILLMDEPTNHLDVDGILWLEGVLTERARACLVVSHDRYFLEHVATRMLELNRVYPRGLFETDGSYSEFLARRDEFLRGQAAYQETLANTVRREIEWLRRGAKARSTKAKGRIKEAGRLIEELEEGRARAVSATAGIHFTSSTRPPRQRGGKAFRCPPGGARGGGRPSAGGRAGPHPHRPPDAGARRSAHPRRAHQRPRHPHARSARGQPRGVRRRARPRHPRPLHARARVHGDPRPRRPWRNGHVRRLRSVGSGPHRCRSHVARARGTGPRA